MTTELKSISNNIERIESQIETLQKGVGLLPDLKERREAISQSLEKTDQAARNLLNSLLPESELDILEKHFETIDELFEVLDDIQCEAFLLITEAVAKTPLDVLIHVEDEGSSPLPAKIDFCVVM